MNHDMPYRPDRATLLAAAEGYLDLGWEVFPLPWRRKHPPPRGVTGRAGQPMPWREIRAAIFYGHARGLGLRMPDGVIGLDVDAYGGKRGRETLARMEAEYGPLPPTWVSTARDDGVSGIRLYRVPRGTVLADPGPGVEVIQHHHRYAVVWPSAHPEGMPYRWNHPGLPGTDLAALS